MPMIVFLVLVYSLFFFKQKTAYEIRMSDWSSDVCSSDLRRAADPQGDAGVREGIGEAQALRLPLHQRPPAGKEDRPLQAQQVPDLQIGRASCRERVCQYV